MRKYEKEIILHQLEKEEITVKQLEKIFKEALDQVNIQIKVLQADELSQSKIYQQNYQKAIKQQLEAILNRMKEKQYSTLQEYLNDCYFGGYTGALYSLQQQGIPLVIPIDQRAVVKAVQLDSKINGGLYNALGVDSNKLKKTISSEITRGIATAMPVADIARNISNASKAPLSRTMTIARTEGHRIQEASAFDAMKHAHDRGANVFKVWNSVLDGRTRPTHRQLWGQVREIDELYEINGKKAMYPGGFRDPAEDCNCRCKSLARSRTAITLGVEETEWLGDTENMTDQQLQPLADKLHISVDELRKYRKQIIPVKASSYEDFIRQYNKIIR